MENVDNKNEIEEKENKQNDTNTTNKREIKNKGITRKQQIIILFVAMLVIIGLTVAITLIKIKSINKEQNEIKNQETEVVNNKKKAEDEKFVLKNYNDTYFYNDLTITDYYIVDGKETKDSEKEGNVEINYVQISGLKDKTIQNSINEEIKKVAIEAGKAGKYCDVSVYVRGNFSNILSLDISTEIFNNKAKEWDDNTTKDKTDTLNYNLTNGEKLKFEEIFTSSTPIKSILADAVYKALAWDTELNMDMSEEEWDKNVNMDRRDTSEYEDIILKVINNYELNKDNIDFSVTPTRIVIDNLYEKSLDIRLLDYRDYVAIYRRYSNKEIFEKQFAMDNVIAFTDKYNDIIEFGEYGQVKDNLFLDFGFSKEYIELGNTSDSVNQKIVSAAKKQIDDIISKIKSTANKNTSNGYVLEGYINTSVDIDGEEYEPYFYINIDYCITKMSKQYYTNNLFEKYVMFQNGIKVSVEDAAIYYNLEGQKGINVEDKRIELYYDLDGKYLGNKESDLIKIEQEVEEVEQEEPPVVEENENNEQTDNNVDNNTENNTTVNPYAND